MPYFVEITRVWRLKVNSDAEGREQVTRFPLQDMEAEFLVHLGEAPKIPGIASAIANQVFGPRSRERSSREK